MADATAGTTLTPAAPAGTDAKNMILPAGTFGFYAISTNSSTEEVPAFNTVANDGYPTDDAKNTTALVNESIICTLLERRRYNSVPRRRSL